MSDDKTPTPELTPAEQARNLLREDLARRREAFERALIDLLNRHEATLTASFVLTPPNTIKPLIGFRLKDEPS